MAASVLGGAPRTRVPLFLAIATGLFVLLFGGPGAGPASAKAKTRAVDTYCSPTGDYCTEITRKGGKHKFKLVTFAHRGKAKFCVKPKGRKKDCKSRKLKADGDGIFVAKIGFEKNFPSRSGLKRKVTVSNSGAKLGPALKFRP